MLSAWHRTRGIGTGTVGRATARWVPEAGSGTMGGGGHLVKYDKDKEAEIAASFEEIGDALIQIFSASRQPDWDIRHHAAESLGKAAVGVYQALTQEGRP